jgi:hypothetical protein
MRPTRLAYGTQASGAAYYEHLKLKSVLQIPPVVIDHPGPGGKLNLQLDPRAVNLGHRGWRARTAANSAARFKGTPTRSIAGKGSAAAVAPTGVGGLHHGSDTGAYGTVIGLLVASSV